MSKHLQVGEQTYDLPEEADVDQLRRKLTVGMQGGDQVTIGVLIGGRAVDVLLNLKVLPMVAVYESGD